MKHIAVTIAGLTILVLFSLSVAADEADLILYNGKVITVDDGDNIFQAIAIKGDTILAVGSDADILESAGPQTKMIDLHGKTVTPGLMMSVMPWAIVRSLVTT